LVKERTAKLQQALFVIKRGHLDSVRALAEVINAGDHYNIVCMGAGHAQKGIGCRR